jgi:hypothetical protein
MATYDLTRFPASHNSYSGHDRESLLEQLDAGVRGLELDFHDNGFKELKDYRIGHLKGGAEVDHHAPNPPDALLMSWLRVVASWSAAHPGHEPLTMVLDSKDDLTDNTNGDLADLNGRLEEVFGPSLFTREEFDGLGGWPDVSDMRDRVVCVLSGDSGTRMAYRWAFGSTPAVGGNAAGSVVLAYRSPSGQLNCWAGAVDGAAGIANVVWHRKGMLAVSDVDLAEPAIGINDDGWVVAVYRFGPRFGAGAHGLRLGSKVGTLHADGRIAWSKMHIIQAVLEGRLPSLKMDGDNLELIYSATADGTERKLLTGTIDRTKKQVKWKKPKKTVRPLFPRDVTSSAALSVQATVDGLGSIGCVVDGGPSQPVRFEQVMFVERQKGEDPHAFRDALFFAAGAGNRDDITQARAAGLITRAWGFSKVDIVAPPQENFPATDTPHQAWYQAYLSGASTFRSRTTRRRIE